MQWLSPINGVVHDPMTLFAGLKGITLAQGLQVGGTLLSAAGAVSSGNAQNAASEYNAAMLERQGKAEQAVAQRDAQKERKQKELAISRARAVGASSGGGQDYNLIGDLEEEGEYNALVADWEGAERAAGRRSQAGGERFTGRQAKRAGQLKSFSTLLSGGASFYDKYAG